MNEEQKQQDINYEPPMFMPISGRIVCIAIEKKPVKISRGGLKNFVIVQANKDNFDRERSNPFEGYDYIIVSMAADVNRNLAANGQLPIIKGHPVPIEIHDRIVTSANMQPVMVVEGIERFFLWHYADVLGISKNPANMKAFFERIKNNPLKVPDANPPQSK